MINQTNHKILNQLNININNLLLRLKLAHIVNKQPINLHYKRSLEKLKKEILMADTNNDEYIEHLKHKTDSLLIMRQSETVESDVSSDATIISSSDLEGTAQLVEDTIEKEKENEENNK